MNPVTLRSEPRAKTRSWVVFSDPAGALLDERTFERSRAKAALERLQQAGIPVVFVSNKTREELTTLRAQFGINAPFAAENGAVIVRGHQPDCILGRRAAELEEAAREIAQETGAQVELLSRMTRRRAMEVTGLPDCQIGPARRRSYSAPFLIESGSLRAVHRAAKDRGLRLVPDGRLLHLTGNHDKGDAVRAIREQYPSAVTIGVGDHPNDLPLLKAVDRAVFLGTARPPRLPAEVRLEPKTGPTSWSRAVWSNLKPPTPRIVGGM